MAPHLLDGDYFEPLVSIFALGSSDAISIEDDGCRPVPPDRISEGRPPGLRTIPRKQFMLVFDRPISPSSAHAYTCE